MKVHYLLKACLLSGLAASSALAQPALTNCTPAAEGLIAWWKGESNVVDSVRYIQGEYLPANLSPWAYTTGKVDAAFQFLQGGYVYVPALPELDLGAGAGLTVEGWIRSQSTQAEYPVLCWSDGSQVIGLGLSVNGSGSGTLDAVFRDSSAIYSRGAVLRSPPSTVSNLVWQHVALTFDKATGLAALYCNGALVVQTNLGSFRPATAFNFYIGRYPNSTRPLSFVGAVDEISLYDRALSAAEIQAIVLADSAGKCPPPPLPPTGCPTASAELVGWWRGESNTLDTVSFNHGTMFPINMPPFVSYSTGRVSACFALRYANYLVIPASSELDVAAGPGLTVEAWVNPYSTSYPIVEWNSGTGTQGVYLAYSASRGPNYLEANLMDDQGQSHLMQSPYLPSPFNQWRHVGMTYDRASGVAMLFVNGLAVTQTNLGSFTPRTSGDLYLGYRPSGSYPGSGARFNGWLDEIAVYRRALTPAELQCVYVRAAEGKYPSAPCEVDGTTMAGWWRGESNALDSVSFNHGRMFPVGLPVMYSYTNGLFGDCFSLRNANHVVIPGSANLDVGVGPGLTLEAWVNPYATSYPIAEWNSGTGTQGVYLGYSVARGPNYLEANLVDDQGQSHVILSPLIPQFYNQWRHVALTYDRASGTAVLYMNGTALTHTNLGSFTPRTTGDLYLGYRPPGSYPGSGLRFNGWMDEVAVHRRALTLAEVRCVYFAGASGKYPAPMPCLPPTESLVGWWRGESNAVDSVQGNHGLMYPWPEGSYTNGQLGSAFAAGPGRYVVVRSPAGLDVGAGPGLTAEAWINPNPSTWGGIVAWDAQSGGLAVALEGNTQPNQGGLRAILTDTQGITRLVTSPYGIIRTGQWQHVAMTYDRTSGWAALFVNGAPVTATNLGVFTPQTSGGVYFGVRSQAAFNGALDEIAIHNRALSPWELYSIYQAANGRCMTPPVIVEQPESLRVNVGGNAVFHVVATGNPELRYQWYSVIRRRPEPITLLGETNTTLILSNVRTYQDESFGYHFVQITNAFGSARSDDILLRVNLPPLADVSTTPTPVIAHNLSNALVVLDATRSKDPNGDPLDYRWQWLGATELLATGAVVTVTLPVGTNALTLTVDDGLATDTQSFVVEVITPADAVARLATLVASTLPKPQPLLATLAAAEAAINRGNMTAALHQLEAFQNKVRAQLLRVNPALADQLIQAAQEVMDHLNGNSRTRGRFVKVERSAGGKLRLAFVSPRGVAVVVQASTNLVDWENMGVAADRGDGVFEFEDADSLRMPTRFYRVVVP